ncbi:MAG: hypothetical protein U9R27_09085 [Campylobacterota bacterium]|nr:hypothetical protein [Campylobacterota bacterium]
MQTIKTVLLSLTTLALLLGGCGSFTNLTYHNNQLSLQIDDKHLNVHGDILTHHKDNFGDLYLLQDTIKLKDGSIVVYEKAQLDSEYELNFPTRKSVEIVFETRDIKQIYFNKGFFLYQIRLKDGRTLNLSVEQYADQRISFVYGMSTAQMRKILTQLDAKSSRPLVEDVITLPQGRGAIKSRWSSKKIYFAPLIRVQVLIGGL